MNWRALGTEFRLCVIWITGLIASTFTGSLIAIALNDAVSRDIYAIVGICWFVCLRLWATERRPDPLKRDMPVYNLSRETK